MTRTLRQGAALLLALLLPLLRAVPARALQTPAPPEIHAGAAVLMDADTGQVLCEKDARRRMEPASLTKIMTCLLAMEAGSPEQAVTVTAEATRLMPGAAALGLQEGEVFPLAQLLYAAMLPSANDAANAVGIHLAGSSAAFARQMNRRAEELGLEDTHFVNASGLPARDHYTTAYDLAQITREALKHPEFLDYAGTPSHYIPAGDTHRAYSFSHLNRALLPGSGYFDRRAVAGKTGWTYSAGNCLMTVAEENGARLIAVILHAGGDGSAAGAYPDTRALFDYGFSAFRPAELPVSADGFLARLEGGEYYLTPAVDTLRLLIPADAPEEGLSLALAGTAWGTEGSFRGPVTLLDGGGSPLWEGGEIPLSGSLPLAEESLGPSAVAYLPRLPKKEPRLPWLPWIEFAAAAAGVAAVALLRLLRKK